VVKLLLERGDVNPDRVDTEFGRTPLSHAAENGREGVVKMLLERKDVHPATPDNTNQKPLSLALSNGNHRVANMLRERNGVDSNIAPDRVG